MSFDHCSGMLVMMKGRRIFHITSKNRKQKRIIPVVASNTTLQEYRGHDTDGHRHVEQGMEILKRSGILVFSKASLGRHKNRALS